MTKRQSRGEATIERVLDATLECVVSEGLHDLSIEDVCTRSGVSVGSVYHHFDDRHGLLFALYRRCLERMLSDIVHSVVSHADAQTGVKAMVVAYLCWVERHSNEARVIYGLGEGDFPLRYRAELAEVGARVIAPLALWLTPFIARHELVPMPPGLLEVVLIGPAAEASRRILGGASRFSFRQARQVLPEAVWRSITLRSPAEPTPRSTKSPPRRRAFAK